MADSENRTFEGMSLEELQEQAEALQEEIRQRQKAEVANARVQIREIAARHGLEVTIRMKGREEPAEGREPARAKYRNPDTGDSWSGRGRKPKWLVEALDNGGKLEDFSIGERG